MYRAFLEFFVGLEFFNFDYFDRILLVVQFVDCSVHFAVGSLADHLVKGIVLDDSYHTISNNVYHFFRQQSQNYHNQFIYPSKYLLVLALSAS